MNLYVIVARENYPGATMKEICRCNRWPNDIKNALVAYTEPGALGTPIPKYAYVEIIKLTPNPRPRKCMIPTKTSSPLFSA